MIKKLANHWPFILLVLTLAIYLGAKAIPENSWDGWRVGSAQAMLSDKHWAKDGFFKNYFLFLPQGYSKIVRYFDDPELRQHTRGITTGGLIGKRLYYTHYPSGYLFPSALLMKLGVENRFYFRLLEILISLTGLVFLYWFFNLVSNHWIAFLGVFYYGASVLFLDYADNLSAYPIEELLRFIIIALSTFAALYSVKISEKKQKYLNYFLWLLYFIMAFSSYDATFFIFAWLIGLDLIIRRKINWRKWLFWASAPILAFGLQILQNTWYLGWHDMLFDFFGTFKTNVVGSRKNLLISHFNRLTDPFDWFFGVKWYLGILISAAGIATVKFINSSTKFGINSEQVEWVKKYRENIFNMRFLCLGFLAILFHFLFFPSLFFYQSRIISVFGGLLIGSLTVLAAKAAYRKTSAPKLRIVFLVIFIATLGLWFVQINRTYAYLKQWPNNIWPQEKIDFDKKIKNLVSGDKVIFQMLGPDRQISGTDRYPTASPEDEYYTDAPMLGFTNANDLIRDLNYLKRRSEFNFTLIVITDLEKTIKEIEKNLKTQESIQKINNKYVLIVK